VALVDGERRFLGGALAQRVDFDLFGEVFAYDVSVSGWVEVEGEQVDLLVVVDEGFDYVVADAFSAAVDVEVWVYY
jgi:hypothetical protein